MKRLIVIILTTALLLTGCAVTDKPNESETPVVYDWMAGESPVPECRTGIMRQGISRTGWFECTESGFYYLTNTYKGTFLLYGDHESDTVIKLCGRPDCAHDGEECNAYFSGASSIGWYDGYLYVADGAWSGYTLVRINLDGTERVVITNTDSVTGASKTTACPMIWNGIFSFMTQELDSAVVYYYLLDGSMEEFQTTEMYGLPAGNHDDAFLVMIGETDDSGKVNYWRWDPVTGANTFLAQINGLGYVGTEAAYYIRDGIIYCLEYDTGEERMLHDTGLEGEHILHCFPDCIVVSDYVSTDALLQGAPQLTEVDIHIYNWDFELVGSVTQACPGGVSRLSCAETQERIILMGSPRMLPRYYIEKSELGTGNVKIHEYKLPDLEEEIRWLEEDMQDFG